jgi:hypothetical protein
MSDRLSRRPRTLVAVANRVRQGQQAFDPAVREFLDSFYADPANRPAAIRDQPDKIGPLPDAYLAAVAEYLASAFNLTCPDWTETHGRELVKPFFAGGLESLKATLLVESPAAFRRRMIFIGKNALSRPRMPEQPEPPAANPFNRSDSPANPPDR